VKGRARDGTWLKEESWEGL